MNPAHFARIHRSFMVNLDRVARLKPWFSGDYLVTLESGRELRLSRTYRERVQQQLLGIGSDDAQLRQKAGRGTLC
jgi:two-component system LytT family response regulator